MLEKIKRSTLVHLSEKKFLVNKRKGGTDEIGRNHYKYSQVPGPQILTELRI